MSLHVSSLHRYPVKSLQGEAFPCMSLDEFGLEGDRRFMLVDDHGRFITQRDEPLLSQCGAQFKNNRLTLEFAGHVTELAIEGFNRHVRVQVWSDWVDVWGTQSALHGLTEWLGRPVQLVYMPDSCFRQVDRDFFAEPQRVGFADGFPLLLTNLNSLKDLNARLESPVAMSRFRPNIVVDGADAYAEDSWKRIRVGNIEMELVKPCSRCVMTTIDARGNKGQEPLRTLASYRRNEYGVCFGQNVVHRARGEIRVGDPVTVLR